jgi:two-component system, NarL family, sensor histidine kinase DesK
MSVMSDPRSTKVSERPPVSFNAAYLALFGFLGFVAFPIVDLFRSGASTAVVIGVLATVAVFVVVYVRTATAGPPAAISRALALQLALLYGIATALSVLEDQRWLILFSYVAAACGLRLEGRIAYVAVLANAATVGVIGVSTGFHGGATASYVISVLAIGFLMSAFRWLIRTNVELRAARSEVARLAANEERLRIARDLHDLLGHSLSVIALKSELAGKLLRSDPEQAAAEIADVTAVSRRALGDVRDAVGGYRRIRLDSELEGARTALASAGIECAIDVPAVTLPDDVETVLAWAVREGTTNVVRHSGARSCSIRLQPGLREVELELVDDGIAAADGQGATGSGLAGLAERAERLQGRLEAGRLPDGGFRLRLTVPAEAR